MDINIIDLGKLSYGLALEIQTKLLLARQKGLIPDTLLIVEHPPVITVGIRGKYSNILVPKELLRQKNIEVFEINRGGDVTYHGDGQIVGYPIFDLNGHNRDIKQFIWNIEEVFIGLLKNEFNIDATREEKKYTGVWVGNDKITAIGMEVKRWVTMHGFAFNVNTDMENFKLINPCGLTEKGVTSLEKITESKQDFETVKRMVINYFCEVFKAEEKRIRVEELGI